MIIEGASRNSNEKRVRDENMANTEMREQCETLLHSGIYTQKNKKASETTKKTEDFERKDRKASEGF